MTDPTPAQPDDLDAEETTTALFDDPPRRGAGDADEEWEDDPQALPRRPRRRWVTPVTAGLAVVLVAALGFIGGVEVQKGQQSGGGAPAAAAGGVPAGLRAAFAGGGQGGGEGGGQGGASAPTTGSVASKDGSTLYVAGVDGTTVKVKTNANSKVTRTADSSVDAVQPGDTVVIQGTTNSNGTVTATQITATAKGVTAGGPGRGFGGGLGGRRGGPSG